MNTAEVVAIILVYVVALLVILFVFFSNKISQITSSTSRSTTRSTTRSSTTKSSTTTHSSTTRSSTSCHSSTYVYATADGFAVTLSNSNTTASFSNTTSVTILISACPNETFTVQREVLCSNGRFVRLISNTYTNYTTDSSGSVQFVVPAAGGACITNIYITGPGITNRIYIRVTNT